MERALDSLDRIANTKVNVLVTGESGTGKECVVRAIHELSPWQLGPFVPINCGAIPEPLLESELFGHARGAFTGADRARPGRFELANGGTLFFDEIAEMPLNLQVKLLRVLQERVFEPLGSAESRKATFRVVAATNVDLERAVESGSFRQDLFFRLDVVRVHLPPLRERPCDVPPLVDHFIASYRQTLGVDIEGITDDALRLLQRHNWPGNVRELENVIQSVMVIKGHGLIEVEDVALKFRSRLAALAPVHVPSVQLPEKGLSLPDALGQLERSLIHQALHRTGGNKSMAASLLGINRTTLVEKIKRLPLAAGE
jgi:transcriptional regulator with PAS, ATPase and Fis domain